MNQNLYWYDKEGFLRKCIEHEWYFLAVFVKRNNTRIHKPDSLVPHLFQDIDLVFNSLLGWRFT